MSNIKHLHDRMLKQINDYTQEHSKVLMVPFDVKFPKEGNVDIHKNSQMGKCMARVMQKLKRDKSYQNLDPKYCYVREQLSSEHPHYHAYLLLNGRETQNGFLPLSYIQACWSRMLGLTEVKKGLVHISRVTDKATPDFRGLAIKRGEPLPADVQRRVSYMGKQHSKGAEGDGTRDFAMSQQKPSNTKLQSTGKENNHG